MSRFADRVKETSTTTGTGTLNLGGTSAGFRTFVAGIGTGNKCYYSIVHRTADEWEVGLGTVTSGSPDTLSRDTILSSSNSGSAVNFSAGTKDVFVTIPAAEFPVTTKGDLIAGIAGGSVDRLPIGADGRFLMADAAEAAGMKWTTVPPVNISVLEPISLQMVAGTIASKAGTVTGTAGFGSSLFLKRITAVGRMSASEIQMALSIGFPATNQGAGTMSRTFGLYSFGNSTSLALVSSVSGTSAWGTGTSTAGASSSLTQFQGGWSSPLIQQMTFASFTFGPGEYVVAQLFDFAQGSSTWTLNLYGPQAASTLLASAATNLTSATLGAMSSGGLAAVSAFTASSSSSLTAFSAAPTALNALSSNGLLAASAFTASASSALTAWSAAPTAVNALSSNGLLAGSVHTASSSSSLTAWSAAPTAMNALSSTGLLAASGITGALGVARYGAAFVALSTAGSHTAFILSHTASTAASSFSHNISSGASAVALSATNSAKSISFQLKGESTNNSIVSAVTLGVQAGSILTASDSGAVLSNAGTSAFAGFLGSGGFLAGSFLTASGSGAALSNAGTSAFAGFMGSAGLSAGSFHTASGSGAAISNAGTAAFDGFMGSGGLSAGSFIGTTGSLGAVTNVALGALNSSTLAQLAFPNFGFIGTGSTTSGYPTVFQMGIMSTGALPANITLTSTAVTMSGSFAAQQPWFLIAGA